jgi:hypothetical protein
LAKSDLAEIGWATWGFVPHFVPHTTRPSTEDGGPQAPGVGIEATRSIVRAG